jgi:hypothetical protein
MILLLLATAHAGSWGGLRNTAETLEPGEVVLRPPTARSAAALSSTTELFLTPFDGVVGGPRVGVEQALVTDGPVTWSLAPSIAEKWSLGRTDVRVESLVSGARGSDRVTLVTAVDLNFLRTTVLAEEKSREWSLDRVHVPVSLVYDHSLRDTVLRASGVVGVVDEGRTFTWGSLVGSWIHRWGGLHVELGAGLFVGQPSEHIFLGTYERTIVSAYPKVDLWWQF